MWNIFYDVCLAAIKTNHFHSTQPITGYPLRADSGIKFDESGNCKEAVMNLGTTTVTAVAYMDDAVFFSKSKAEKWR